MAELDKVLAEFTLPDWDQIAENGRHLLLEQQVKHRGIWRVHKSDPDKVFPSDFHADRVDAPEKLDLYTGQVFSKTNGNLVGSLPRKAMRFIYSQLSLSKEPEIQAKLSQTGSFTYLN